jgi:hypothetical protein
MGPCMRPTCLPLHLYAIKKFKDKTKDQITPPSPTPRSILFIISTQPILLGMCYILCIVIFKCCSYVSGGIARGPQFIFGGLFLVCFWPNLRTKSRIKLNPPSVHFLHHFFSTHSIGNVLYFLHGYLQVLFICVGGGGEGVARGPQFIFWGLFLASLGQ